MSLDRRLYILIPPRATLSTLSTPCLPRSNTAAPFSFVHLCYSERLPYAPLTTHPPNFTLAPAFISIPFVSVSSLHSISIFLTKNNFPLYLHHVLPASRQSTQDSALPIPLSTSPDLSLPRLLCFPPSSRHFPHHTPVLSIHPCSFLRLLKQA